jgi:hypothetical protein
VVLVVLVAAVLLVAVVLVVQHFSQLKLWFLLVFSLAVTTVIQVLRVVEEAEVLAQLLLAPLVVQEYKLT